MINSDLKVLTLIDRYKVPFYRQLEEKWCYLMSKDGKTTKGTVSSKGYKKTKQVNDY